MQEVARKILGNELSVLHIVQGKCKTSDILNIEVNLFNKIQ